MLPGFAANYTSGLTFVENILVAAEGSAAATTAETEIAILPMSATIKNIKIGPTGSATASDTTYATITVARRDGAGGSGSTLVAPTTKLSGSGGTGNWAAFTTLDAGTVGNSYCAAGTVLTYKVEKASTGVQLPSYVLSIQYTVAL
jgi:hypothetical protein